MAAAPPAYAAKGVSNLGQDTAAGTPEDRLKDYAVASSFYTGFDGAKTFKVSSIVVDFGAGAGGSSAELPKLDQVWLDILESRNQRPGATVATLMAEGDFVPGDTGNNTFVPLHGQTVTLEGNRYYWIALRAGLDTSTARVDTTSSESEDSESCSNWFADRNFRYRARYSTTWQSIVGARRAIRFELNVDSCSGSSNELSVSANDVEVHEGPNATLDFEVKLSRALTTGETVDVSVTTIDNSVGYGIAGNPADAVVGQDYWPWTGRLSFTGGQQSKTVSVQVIDDVVEDSGERLRLALTRAVYTPAGENPVSKHIPTRDGWGTILNTEEAASLSTLSVADAEAVMGESGALEFTVELTPATTGTVTVNYATADGTATAGTDYAATSGTLTFLAGETSKTVSVPILEGAADGETVTLTLSGEERADLGDAEATGTIHASDTVDEEPEGNALTVRFDNVPAGHAGAGANFTFRVLFSEEPDVSFRVLRDESFAVTGGAVRKAKRVDRRNDLREIHVEPSGWGDVSITLAGGRACGTTGAICTAGGKALSNTLTATVRGPVAVSVADAKVEEGPGAVLDFAVSLSRAATGPVTVDYATADGRPRRAMTIRPPAAR